MPDRTDSTERIAKLSAKRLALLAIELQNRVDAFEEARHEPMAVIGIGCRFPGNVSGPESYWELLRQGVDAIGQVPHSRWDVDAYYDPEPGKPGKAYTRHGGFLAGVEEFDAAFFGISPREAAGMDPQHRMLLETSWEAIEDAGQCPDRLAGTSTGVFIGIGNNDYALLGVGLGEPGRIDAYLSTGNTASAAAGRISYFLGLQGPSLVVDTACSSSLVALHLACQSLRNQECRMAIAGGVNLILSPTSMLALGALRMLAPDGRCKTFDAAADGFVRGEGCGLVVLKRFSDARADGDRVLALIRGSAINQDGHSSGLTAPNGPAQQAVIRKALDAAAVAPAEIQYVEAHGTGTSLGDPIEVQALNAVLAEGRSPEHPLRIGSVKTNLGHLEAAAGIAGLIKTVLSLEHAEIPPHLNFNTPNPYITWDQMCIEVAKASTPWRPGRRIAGVSAFGVSGTNVHVVVEQGPSQEARVETVERPLHVLTLSAKTEDALRQLTGRYIACLATATEPFADICYSANTGRAHLQHRLAVIAATASEAKEKLTVFSESGTAPGLYTGKASRAPKVGFVFLGETLNRTEPVWHDAWPAFQRAVAQYACHPPEFREELAFAEIWRSWCGQPWVVVGKGRGEYEAACFLEALTEEQARRLYEGGEPAHVPVGTETLQESCEVFVDIGANHDWAQLLAQAGSLYVRGGELDWTCFDRDYPRRKVRLPTYPFQRQRYWLEPTNPPAAAFSNWLYRLDWQEKKPANQGETETSAPGTWLVFADRGGVGEELAQRFRDNGRTCRIVVPGGRYCTGEDGLTEIDPNDPDHLRRLFDQERGGAPVSGVVHLLALDQSSETDFDTGLNSALRTLHAFISRERPESLRIWIVTRNCQHAGVVTGWNPGQATLWGLGRAFALEHPEAWGGMIDLGGGTCEQQAADLFSHLSAPDGEDQVAFRGAGRYVARLVRHTLRTGTLSLRPDATYLITGGYGAIGLHMARQLAAMGARHLVLLGRRGASADGRKALCDLEEAGIRVLQQQGDVAQLADLDRALAAINRSLPPLRGVVHAAGVLDDGVLRLQSAERFATVLGPKAAGAWHLHTRTLGMPLDFFVMCSSAASLFGSAGQSNYSAANAFLDALAQYRCSQGLPALSINWGPWTGGGMATAQSNERERRWAAQGIGSIMPTQGIEAFSQLLTQRDPQIAVVPVDWKKAGRQFAGQPVPPMFSALAAPHLAEPNRDPPPEILKILERTVASERLRVMIAFVRDELSSILGFAGGQPLDVQQGFFEMGLDSLMAVEFKNRLQAALARPLPGTVIFEYSNLQALSTYLMDRVLPPGQDPAPLFGKGEEDTPLELLEEVEQLSEQAMAAFVGEQWDFISGGKR